MRLCLRHAWISTTLGLLSLTGAASAETVGAKLNAFEAEARQLGTDLPQTTLTTAVGQRRLVDAVISYRLGDYETSALMLFDLVGSKSLGAETDQATFYLGESLYQKGDRGAARTYYTLLTANPASTSGKYYLPSLLRLVEIAIVQQDDAAEALAAIDRVGPTARTAAVPYVRGKYAFANGKLDEALGLFNDVPKGSEYELQATYYTATIAVSKKDLTRATDLFTGIIARRPKSSNDRRVVELSQLALGRLYYERDQFSKSIDNYLLVDRKSDLFPDALYEVSWVYVKNKQFDKALRALELLAISDPQSTKTPTVRLLEGNLRIRKAQMLRQAEIIGTVDKENHDVPDTEYDKASAVFAETHDLYLPSYQALAQMVDTKADPTQFIMQIAGRSSHVFQSTAPLPDAAAQWLRDEPDVERFVSVERDLGDIQSNIDEADAIITRLESVLAANDKTSVYPQLGSRRSRIGQIQDDLIKMRGDLADQELRLVDSNGELSGLSGNRKTLSAQYGNLGSPEQAYADRLVKTRKDYDTLETSSEEIETTIDQTQAIAVALRKYTNDAPPSGAGSIPADQKTNITQTLDSVAQESVAIDAELKDVHRELQLGRDLAGVGDDGIVSARALRKQVKDALDGEHRVLAGFAAASRDPGKSKSLAALADQAARISATLDTIEFQIDQITDKNISQAKLTLTEERKNVVAYRAELALYEQDARDIGGTVLGASFKNVKAKFYDVVIRADVGTVDVAWAQKSDTDDDLKRFNLNRSRELKQLKDEFKDILEAGVPKPSAPRKVEPMPRPANEPAATSPDKGGTRVAPVDDKKKPATAPAVKPDAKVDPKAPKAPKGGPR